MLALILTDMKYWKHIIICLGLTPFPFIISLLTFYFHAGRLLGHLPLPSINDPKNFPIYSTYDPIINVTANLWLFSFFSWTIVVVLYLYLYNSSNSRRFIIYTAIGHGLAIILFCSIISEWYAD